mmetsp:Transcript_21421/g.44783  ORF Transcript_21421/g.44783 Transcript_21421/m.44783 type:complete len:139 (+) Transcript_21421:57-473(+)
MDHTWIISNSSDCSSYRRAPVANKNECHARIQEREARGDGDMLTDMQESHMPEMNDTLVGYKIEMLFEYQSADGGQYLDWAHGEVTHVMNTNTRRVKIEWDNDCVAEGDVSISTHVLFLQKWNPKNVSAGAGRQYLVK